MVCDYNEYTADVFVHAIYYFPVTMYVSPKHDLYLIQNLINFKHCPLKYKYSFMKNECEKTIYYWIHKHIINDIIFKHLLS